MLTKHVNNWLGIGSNNKDMKAILNKLYGNNKTKTELKKVELSAISEISEGYKQTMLRHITEALEYAIELVMDAEATIVTRLFKLRKWTIITKRRWN